MPHLPSSVTDIFCSCFVFLLNTPFLAITMYILVGFLFPCLIVSLRMRGYDQYGCSTTDPTSPCIQPNQLPSPQQLTPATIITNTDDSGFLTASSLPGDDGSSGDPGDVPVQSVDPAAKYMIVAPPLDQLQDAPPLIICAIEECTTSTTTAPNR